jgi:anaerobic magnesium-protoporphyrin IX monomethyl ester cyclase
MHNYRRFYMRKTFLEYPWIRDKQKRKYMLGCLKAFAVSGFQRKFYDLGRVNYWGPQSAKNVDFGFDETRTKTQTIVPLETGDWKSVHRIKEDKTVSAAAIMACGGGKEQLTAEVVPPPKQVAR